MAATTTGIKPTIEGAGDSGSAGTTTSEQAGLIASSGSGEFMVTVMIIGGASVFALGLVCICCRWLIKFTSVEQREIRRKLEFEALQREQERLQKALLEMNSTEDATKRRAERAKQKLVEQMNKQEEIRVRNERQKAKRLKELAYELKKQGTGIVIDGLDDSDDDELPALGAAAGKEGGMKGAAEHGGGSGGGGTATVAGASAVAINSNNNNNKAPESVDEATMERRKAIQERDRLAKERALKVKEDLNPDANDADEGEPITLLPPPAYHNDTEFFKRAGVSEAARLGRLLPAADKQRYHKPWERVDLPKQRFVPGLSVRRVIPPTGDECPKVPVVVYDEEKDDFVYISHDEHMRRLAEEARAVAVSATVKDKEARERARKGIFEEVDAAASAGAGNGANSNKRLSELPPLKEPWTTNTAEQPLARAHTGVRASTDVRLQPPRWHCEEVE